MNILHIVYASVWGGGEQYVYNFCDEQKKCENNSIVVVDVDCEALITKFSNVAKVIAVPLRGIYRFFAWKKILKVVDESKIDILNCHSGAITALCAIIKTLRPQLKLVIFRHNVTPNKSDWYHKFIQAKGDAFVCVSRLVYNLQVQTAQKNYRHKFYFVPNGINIRALKKREIRFDNKEYFIGYAGRITENKGVLVLAEALLLLNRKYNVNVKMILCGVFESNFRHKFEEWVRNNGFEDRVINLGFLDDMNEFFSKIDLFVLPSKVKESFGLVICEAMYCGVPVISTDSGAQREIICDGENGFIVHSGCVEELSNRIYELCLNEQLRNKFVDRACKMVEDKYTVERMVGGINEIYGQLFEYDKKVCQ